MPCSFIISTASWIRASAAIEYGNGVMAVAMLGMRFTRPRRYHEGGTASGGGPCEHAEGVDDRGAGVELAGGGREGRVFVEDHDDVGPA